jgi:23S rRNA (pseudouridine1915-N3)-methyltransferase
MKIALLLNGKTTDKNISDLIDLYTGRIKKYASFELVTLPDLKNTRNMPVHEQKLREGKKIIQTISDDDYIVILDERGKEFRTVEFAAFLEKTFLASGRRVVIIIGGPWGFSDEIYERADFRLSLSKMTFPHQLIRILFLEQLYRSFTIMKGEPYHHE